MLSSHKKGRRLSSHDRTGGLPTKRSGKQGFGSLLVKTTISSADALHTIGHPMA